ncbi:hypothetical protein AMECASPLE_016062 [Ameca splendens]|uniref:Uncharacterized protein n=1 Tax=Ameca splendens TaxID=208324 RepID=A0ABV0XQW8_9TELE
MVFDPCLTSDSLFPARILNLLNSGLQINRTWTISLTMLPMLLYGDGGHCPLCSCCGTAMSACLEDGPQNPFLFQRCLLLHRQLLPHPGTSIPERAEGVALKLLRAHLQTPSSH